MTYEFNARDSVNDIPTPYKVENCFLVLAALALGIGGTLVLLKTRGYVAARADLAAVASAMAAMCLFAAAVKLAIAALSQLRFYLGRDFPIGLAKELKGTARGNGAGAERIVEQLRNQAVAFEEPKGVLAAVLYSIIRPLNTAPPMVQNAAVCYFQTLIGMLAILGSLSVSYMLFAGTPHEGAVSWAYLPLTGLSLLAPFKQTEVNTSARAGNGALLRIAGMAVFATVGPVLVQRFVPAYNLPAMWIAPAVLLSTSIAAIGLFLGSLLSRVDNITQTSVSCEQTTIHMNCPPAQLWTELGREFKRDWVNGAPNRKYLDVPPQVTEQTRGLFEGNLLEESQPEMIAVPFGAKLVDVFRTAQGRWLLALSLWGVLLGAGAAVAANAYAPQFRGMPRMEMTRSILTVIALCTASALAFRMGHSLWARMYFRSRLVWVEVSGTHQSAELEVGNTYRGRVRARSSLTKVEDATLRVWVAEIVSVAFGKEGQRFVIGLAPNDGYAARLADRMLKFAADQSTLIAPTSSRDLGKIDALAKLEDAAGQARREARRPKDAERLGRQEAPRRLSAGNDVSGGKVKFYDVHRGFGFIKCDDGVDRFFGAEQWGDSTVPKKGVRVSFTPGSTSRGPVAEGVRLAG